MKTKLIYSTLLVYFLGGGFVIQGQSVEKEVSIEDTEIDDDKEQLETIDSLYNKKRLSEFTLKNKSEGFNMTGIIGPFSNPDVGVGAVGVTGIFFNGKKKKPLFSYRPYNHRIIIGTYASTKGLLGAGINYDAPYIFNSLFRFRSMTDFSQVISANYFGTSSDTLNQLSVPTLGSFKRNANLNTAINTVDSEGKTYAKYFHYFLRRFSNVTNIERDFWGGIVRGQFGVQISNYTIKDYTDTRVSVIGQDEKAISQKTKLREDYEAGKISGFHGGFNNGLNVGVAFDTRDYEPNPSSGVFIDFTANFYLKGLASEFEYQRINFTPRFYYQPFKSLPMVMAGRLLFVAHFNEVPFYSMSTAVLTDRELTGIFGGRLTGRGFRQKRFLAPVVTTGTLELRTTLFKTTIFNQKLAFIVAPFIDIGTVYDNIQAMSPQTSRYKIGYGSGFRMSWNLSTIVLADFGFSEEQFGFYFYVEHTY